MPENLTTFVPIKGGDGATTLACLAAGTLARSGRGAVLLLDWSPNPRGDLEALLGLGAETPSLEELEARRGNLSPSLMKGLARRHQGGFDVLGCASRDGK